MAGTERRAARVRSLALPLRAFARRQNGRAPQPEVQLPNENRHEIAFGDQRWIDIVRPTREDMDEIGHEFGFDPLALDDCLSRVQRPKIDDYDEYLFIVMHYPRFNKAERVAQAREVDFFLGRDYLVTVHNGELPPLLRFWARLEEDEEARARYMGAHPEMLMYHVADRLTNYLFPITDRIDRNVDALAERIFQDDPRGAIQDLAAYRRDLISLRRIVNPNRLVISLLERKSAAILREDMDQYWGDISDHFAEVSDRLGEFDEEIRSLDDTFNTLYSYRTNETLRALTLISVVLLPLTLITGFFGQNVTFPFVQEGSLIPFYVITSFMVLVVIGLVAFFRRNNWL